MKRPVPLTSMDELVLDGNDALEQIWSKQSSAHTYHITPVLTLLDHDFSAAWEEYLRGFEGIGIKSIHDIIGFNKRNAEKELPPRTSSTITVLQQDANIQQDILANSCLKSLSVQRRSSLMKSTKRASSSFETLQGLEGLTRQ